MTSSTTDSNQIAGNYIGTNIAGTAAVANAFTGIYVSGGAKNTRIGVRDSSTYPLAERNLISGNVADGIRVESAGTSGTVIAGNFIGTNASGTSAIGNRNHGVVVFGGASNTVVGTNGDGVGDTSEGNLISGNTYDGVSTWVVQHRSWW